MVQVTDPYALASATELRTKAATAGSSPPPPRRALLVEVEKGLAVDPVGVVGRRTLWLLYCPTSSPSDWLQYLSANEKAE
jgi:hypothetical protein